MADAARLGVVDLECVSTGTVGAASEVTLAGAVLAEGTAIPSISSFECVVSLAAYRHQKQAPAS